MLDAFMGICIWRSCEIQQKVSLNFQFVGLNKHEPVTRLNLEQGVISRIVSLFLSVTLQLFVLDELFLDTMQL